jgi:plastocyanin
MAEIIRSRVFERAWRVGLAAGAGAAGIGGAVLLATSAGAGPEQIQFPANYASWEKYAVVDRYDSKQYRELYTSPEAVKAVREGKPIPDGTVIAMAIHSAKVDAAGAPLKDDTGRFIKNELTGVTVMEKRAGWGTPVPEEWRNGDWQYASFTKDGKPNEQANTNIKACFVCHKPHEKQDFVISLASLAGKFPTGPVAQKSGQFDVNVAGFSFGPGELKVPAGQTVTWTNGDDSPHQITVTNPAEPANKTGILLKGESATLKFDKAGSYEYGCALHPAMKGKIEVTGE